MTRFVRLFGHVLFWPFIILPVVAVLALLATESLFTLLTGWYWVAGMAAAFAFGGMGGALLILMADAVDALRSIEAKTRAG